MGSIPTPVGPNGKFITGPLCVSCVFRCLMLVILQLVQFLVEDGVVSFENYKLQKFLEEFFKEFAKESSLAFLAEKFQI